MTPEAGSGCRRERSFRGISRRLAVQYLVGLGGDRVDAGRVEGEGWAVDLTESTVTVGPTLSLTQVEVVFEGDPDRLDDLVSRFARKAMRAGG